MVKALADRLAEVRVSQYSLLTMINSDRKHMYHMWTSLQALHSIDKQGHAYKLLQTIIVLTSNRPFVHSTHLT